LLFEYFFKVLELVFGKVYASSLKVILNSWAQKEIVSSDGLE